VQKGGDEVKNRILLVLLVVMLALSMGLAGCEQPRAAAVVSESTGNLSVMKEDTADWVEAEIGTALDPTDRIKCGGNSGAEIALLDGSTVELEAGTEIEVAALDISTETDSAIIRLKLIIGSIIFRVADIIDPSSRYEVATPTGEVAISGSAVQITVSEDGTTLVCNLEGEIWAVAEGVELQVPEGECCVIRSGEPPELVVVFPDPNLEAAIREAIGKPTGDIYASDLEGLSSLTAVYGNITDLTGLEYCTGLEDLNLRSNQISDISPLVNLSSLHWLNLPMNEITDISPLANLASLDWLDISMNEISDISSLANLTNLTILLLFYNQIGDISPLGNLTSLTHLGLTHNPVSGISPLVNLTNLNALGLTGYRIEDISGIVDLTKLTGLELTGGQISDISALAACSNLTELYLYTNQISDISPLASLTNLTKLWLKGNQISDISPLVQNVGLGTGDVVNLESNPLSSDSINIYIPQLEARGVTVYY
jgi:hypothetical protein